jgi:cardiolipin synthase
MGPVVNNLANFLTLTRIIVIIPIIALFYVDGDNARWWAFGLYTLACITDFFDGYVARKLGQMSNLGKFMDPIADKLLIGSIILMLVAMHRIEGWDIIAGLVILLREITVSGLREFLAEVRVSVPVSRLAKWKTTAQMLALGFLVVGTASPDIIPSVMIGKVLLWASAVLTVVTGYDYFRAGLRHLTNED